jgi:hypothetical protein
LTTDFALGIMIFQEKQVKRCDEKIQSNSKKENSKSKVRGIPFI